MASLFWPYCKCCGHACNVIAFAGGCPPPIGQSNYLIGAVLNLYSDADRTHLIATKTQEAIGQALVYAGRSGTPYYLEVVMDRFVTLHETIACSDSGYVLTPAPGYYCLGSLYCPSPVAAQVTWNDGGIYGPITLDYNTAGAYAGSWTATVVREVPACGCSIGPPYPARDATLTFQLNGQGGAGVNFGAGCFTGRDECPDDAAPTMARSSITAVSVSCPPAFMVTGRMPASSIYPAGANITITE